MSYSSTTTAIKDPTIPAGVDEQPWTVGEQSEAVAEHQRGAAIAERLLDKPVYTHTTWLVSPENRDAFVATWNMLGDLLNALACPPIEVTLIRRVDDPSVFHSIGSWRTLSDAQALTESPDVIDVVARLSGLCSDGAPAVYEVVRKVRPE